MSNPPSITTSVVSMYVKQERIYPRAVTGWFAAWRWVLVWVTQVVFYGLPWLSWNQRPAVLFDLTERRFYIFSMVLHPQDFIYLTGLLVICAYGLFLFTAVAGRLWCGYACPQTVYTEIFMWLETRFEGDRGRRMRRDKGPWNADKLMRKGLTQISWVSLSLWTGFTLVGYFTPIRQLAHEVASLSLVPWEWFWVLFYALATYGNAGYLREQVCKYMCPYARFQSAMFDKDTLIISYDSQRGEPRGARARNSDARAQGKGDCVDCTLCVQVCPTGIDIREGLQYECIGCGACIDVCNTVMSKMGSPPNLIRYATQNGLAKGWTRLQMFKRAARPRVLIYTAVLLLIVGGLGASLMLRQPFRVDIVRDRAVLARQVGAGDIENIYRVQIMNGQESVQHYRLKVSELPGAQLSVTKDIELLASQARWVTVAVQVPATTAQALGPGIHTMHWQIQRVAATTQAGADERQDASRVVEKSSFVIPR